MRKIIFGLLLALPLAAMAQVSPVGTWRTTDDKTGKPKSIVQVYPAANGTLAAKVVTVLQSDNGSDPICKECHGERRNKPIKGMEIMWGVRNQKGAWQGGKILDPKNGKIYSVKLHPVDGGRVMEVRGFVGMSLLGRTQTWTRLP